MARLTYPGILPLILDPAEHQGPKNQMKNQHDRIFENVIPCRAVTEKDLIFPARQKDAFE
jgi:hypothetical protein